MSVLDIQIHDARPPQSGGVITGIPDLSQLNEPTLDGVQDENTRMNCVFTSNADISRFDRPDLNADGDAIKDSIPAYGQGYVGGASQDVIIRSGVLDTKWGTHSYRVDASGSGGQGSRRALLAQLDMLIGEGVPSIVTIPSMWGSQPNQPNYDPDHPNFWTHACVYAGTLADGTCVLCNPWGGFLMYYAPADLALRLCYLCAYPVRRAGGTTPMSIKLQYDAAGKISGAYDADNPAITVGSGFAQAISDRDWLGGEITVPEVKGLPNGASVAVVRGTGRAVLTYSPVGGVAVLGGDIVLVVSDLYAAWQTAKNAPPPAPPVNVKAQIAAVEHDVAALKTALGGQAQ